MPPDEPPEPVEMGEATAETELQNALVILHDDDMCLCKPDALPPSETLLPRPLANTVSLVARSTSLALRMTSAVGGYGLGVAKLTTLSTLELGRDALEALLTRAGRDVFAGSQSEPARAGAESMLETSLERMHQAMSQLVFWTAAGFHVAGSTASIASQTSQVLITILDQFFGSTDSSRAIASIITLIRRQLKNPSTGVQGEQVSATDLVLGLCGLAYLQTKCRRLINEESQRRGYEETIWDVVVARDGDRADALHFGDRDAQGAQPLNLSEENDPVTVGESHISTPRSSDDEDEKLEAQLRSQIAGSLPEEARLSISTSTTTTKVITVEISGASGVSVPSFPSLGLVRSEVTHHHSSSRSARGSIPNTRAVYSVSRNKTRTFPGIGVVDNTVRPSVEELDYDISGQSLSSITPDIGNEDVPPPLPPRPTPAIILSSDSCNNILTEDYPDQAVSIHSPSTELANASAIGPSPSSQVPSEQDRTANQKKTREPLASQRRASKNLGSQTPQIRSSLVNRKAHKKSDIASTQRGEKRLNIRSVLKKQPVPGSADPPSHDSSSDSLSTLISKPNTKPTRGSQKTSQDKHLRGLTKTSASKMASNTIPASDVPRPTQRGNPNYFTSRDLGSLGIFTRNKCPPSSSVPPVQGHQQSSLASPKGPSSIRPRESHPPSPRSHHGKRGSTNRLVRDEASGTQVGKPYLWQAHSQSSPRPPSGYGSIYTLKTFGSESSLVLSTFHRNGAYNDVAALDDLRRSGGVRGMFPDFHFLRNATRYSRYASAVYGYNFLKLMGISKDQLIQNMKDETHHEVRSFAHHAKLPSDSILLASFVDPQGGSDSTGSTDTGVPLVHTIALDEESKSVVLTCRGTLGFEDVLSDMMCEYDDLAWRGKCYKVHKGIHASARRLLYGGDGRVLATIKMALENNPNYGLVLCGHSLGGAVTALLGVMLAEPSTRENDAGFRTSAIAHAKLLNDADTCGVPTHTSLPAGRPIQVYAYGPPATMSPSLQKATRGLITSIVHGNDLVPYLSLGVLHDFQALALAFKADNNEAKAEVRRHVWQGLRTGLTDKWYGNSTQQSNENEEQWGFVTLKTLRASMMSPKLLPPGEVFQVRTTPVMRRDAFTREIIDDIGRPSTRITFKYIKDVEAHFREVQFGSSMLLDHSPGRYEDALRRLMLGVDDL